MLVTLLSIGFPGEGRREQQFFTLHLCWVIAGEAAVSFLGFLCGCVQIWASESMGINL